MNWNPIFERAERALPRRLALRLRIMRLYPRLQSLVNERNVVMDRLGETGAWTTDAMEAYARPIRELQLELESCREELGTWN